MSGGEFSHIPVLAGETVSMLAVRDGVYFDGTIGMGGHSRLLLDARPGIKIVGTDIDPEMAAIATANLASYGDRAKVLCGSYAEAYRLLPEKGINSLAGVLLDLGVSSLHYDKISRGFAFKGEGPLDMRLDLSSRFTAEELVNDWPGNQIEKILRMCGENNSRRIVKAIEKARKSERIKTTTQLAGIIEKTVPSFYGRRTGSSTGRVHPATKTFMALRIAVNSEFENVEKGIKTLAGLVEEGGRIAVITFHSAEDRLVKNLFSSLVGTGTWKKITGKAVLPTEEEIKLNPRARSAQLRVIEKNNRGIYEQF